MLQHALNYIKQGKPIFPCGKNKKPLVDWGEFQKRVPTVEEVTRWWTNFPDANIGMPTGTLSGVSVVDIDPRHGGVVPPGLQTLTTVVKTGSGGWHYYYSHVDGVRNADQDGTGYPGVDIRGEGGFVIVPPSVTDYIDDNGQKAGGAYDFVVVEPLIPFPIDFFKIEQKKFDASKAVLGVGVGSRNMTATSLVGSLISRYPMDQWETVVWPLLRAWNTTNTPPDDEKKVRATFESIVKTHFRNNGEVVSKDNYSLVTLDKVVIEEKDEQRYSIGFPTLDRVLMDEDQIGTAFQGGVSMGEFMIIGGRPKHGKTLLAVQIIKSLTDQGFFSLWLSYEGKMSKLKKIMGKAQVIQENVVVVQLKNSVPLIGRVDWIEEKMKEAIQKYGTKVLVIDNLSFLQPGESSRSSKQYDMLNEIVPAVHRLASQHDIVVILLAHVRKPPNQTGAPKRARMYDLSGTSTLEQLCDIGIMVERQYVDENRYSSKTLVHLDANRPCGEVRTMECFFDNGKLVDIVEETAKKLGGHVIN